MLWTFYSRVSVWKWFVVLLLYSVQANDAQLCSEQESVDITNGTMDGDESVLYRGVQYSAFQYFQDGTVRRGCICLVRQCIYVCDAEEWASGGLTELYANVSGDSGEKHVLVNLATDANYHLILKEPHCAGHWYAPEQHQMIITSEGELNLNDNILDYSEFCMLPKNEMGEFNAFYCELSIASDWSHQIYAWGILMSFFFLVATFVVYAILPELRNLPGMLLMCYVAALGVSYLLLGLVRMNIYGYQSFVCKGTAYTLYFTLMASFFWLNVMSFDIYWTFGGSHGRTTERTKFLYYSLYAWGVPLLFLSLILLFDHTDLISYNHRPNVGEEVCFLKLRTYVSSLSPPIAFTKAIRPMPVR
ncbi:probable G-protein coupled receptor Mth-like 10 isoform X2 [Anopheles darlingi]|uniref:probable G-protein coupled receptor Mth-like 10 isoform X2 n=1 Tax=Anopheles darlingi TaxID=43151 RepID=UPI002100496E|nr:probable G-protein coupled receptor Mth-like 10 isoform X2 [Anopheles darlingi]